MDEEAYIQQTRLLETLNKAVKDLKTIPIPLYSTTNFVAIEKVLELETQLSSSFCNDLISYNLSRLLSSLKTQFNKLRVSQGYGPQSFYRRHIANYEVYKIAASVEAQVQSWIDQEIIKELVHVFLDSDGKEEKLDNALEKFQQRLSSGFDTDLQEEERRELKKQILRRIREASGSESEATSIVAEVLWGSSPLLT